MPPLMPPIDEALERQRIRVDFLIALDRMQPHRRALAVRAMESPWCGLLTEFEANELIRIYSKEARNA